MSHVLVVFQADTERTEQLALAVGVGAVEAEASLRLRRLRVPGAVEVGHKGYGTLAAADLQWADTVVVGLESEKPGTEELKDLVTVLVSLDSSQMKGKQFWTFAAGGIDSEQTEAQGFVEEALVRAGIAPKDIVSSDFPDQLERMKAVGQQFGQTRP